MQIVRLPESRHWSFDYMSSGLIFYWLQGEKKKGVPNNRKHSLKTAEAETLSGYNTAVISPSANQFNCLYFSEKDL